MTLLFALTLFVATTGAIDPDQHSQSYSQYLARGEGGFGSTGK